MNAWVGGVMNSCGARLAGCVQAQRGSDALLAPRTCWTWLPAPHPPPPQDVINLFLYILRMLGESQRSN